MAARWVPLAVATALLVVVLWLWIGVKMLLLMLLLGLFLLWLNYDTLLARLVCWAIGRIPQQYRWSIDKVVIKPAFNNKDWSEISLVNWTWHNPLGFDGTCDDDEAFLLQIDRLTLKLSLATIIPSLTKHEAIEIKLFVVEGLRFKAQRSQDGALNLWKALALPDDDVNVRSFTTQACRYGGSKSHEHETSEGGYSFVEGENAEVVPLPPVSTKATREAAGFWRPAWGPRPDDVEAGLSSASFSPTGERVSTRSVASQPGKANKHGFFSKFSRSSHNAEATEPLLAVEKKYVEEPIGNPRRRPRWGVPCRFDIQRLHMEDVSLWVLDLLMLDSHKTAHNIDCNKTRIDVKSMTISRQRLEAGDDRKAGSVDGTRGVYLGELIFCIAAEVVPIVLKRSAGALTRTAALAAGYMVKDGTKRAGAHVVEGMVHGAHVVGDFLKEAIPHHHSPGAVHAHSAPQMRREGLCTVKVHLISGRQVTRKGRSVNAHALLELVDSSGRSIAHSRSEPQMWTKVPHWDEHFELVHAQHAYGSPMYWTIRVSLYHQKSRQVVGITHQRSKEMPDRFIGEVLVPLKALLIRDPVIGSSGEIVGWFPLTDCRGLRRGTACSGEVKLGFCVEGLHHEEEGSRNAQLLHQVSSGFAILH